MVYKLMVDLNTIDLNLFFEFMDKKNIDVCLAEDTIYLYQKYNSQLPINKIMKKMKISNYFLKEITEKPSADSHGFVFKWIYEKMNADEIKLFEEKHQKELQGMMDNIQKVKDLIKEQQENQKEVLDSDVEGDHFAKAKEGAS